MLSDKVQRKIDLLASDADRYINHNNIYVGLLARGVDVYGSMEWTALRFQTAEIRFDAQNQSFRIAYDRCALTSDLRAAFARILGLLILGYGWDYRTGKLDIKGIKRIRKRHVVFSDQGVHHGLFTKALSKIFPHWRFQQLDGLVELFARDFLMPSSALNQGIRLADYRTKNQYDYVQAVLSTNYDLLDDMIDRRLAEYYHMHYEKHLE